MNGVFERKLFPLYLGIADAAAGDADQGDNGDAENRQKRGLAAHVVLDLNADIRADRHADRHGEGKAANVLGDFGDRQHIACQRHRGRIAHGVHRAHVKANDNQRAEQRERDKAGKGQAEQRQKQQIDMIAVEVIQQTPCDRTKQDGRHGHCGQHDTDFRAGDADFLTIDGDNGDGCIKRCQNQQVCDKEKDKFSVPDFFCFFHVHKAPLWVSIKKYSGNCHYIRIT